MSRTDRVENEEAGENSRSKPKAGEKYGLIPSKTKILESSK